MTTTPQVPDPEQRRKIALDREETEPCERLTPGCCIDHTAEGGDTECECW